MCTPVQARTAVNVTTTAINGAVRIRAFLRKMNLPEWRRMRDTSRYSLSDGEHHDEFADSSTTGGPARINSIYSTCGVKKAADGVMLGEFIVQRYRLTRFYDVHRSATIA
jgi:hypothetical protein